MAMVHDDCSFVQYEAARLQDCLFDGQDSGDAGLDGADSMD